MDGITPGTLAVALLASAVISLVVLWVLGRNWRAEPRDASAPPVATTRTSCFLFQDDMLIDQDAAVGPLPGLSSGDIEDWQDLRQWLGHRFGNLPESLSALEDGAFIDVPATDEADLASLSLSRRRDTARVELIEPGLLSPLDQHRARFLEQALNRYETMLDHAPCAIKLVDPNDRTIWQNSRFAACNEDQVKHLLSAARAADGPERVRIPCPETGSDRHFEVDHLSMGDNTVYFATDITQIARAEGMRREFIQTLTKTFANLTTGLAVFDQNRQLALFNPALLDLTGLPVTFLSAQPTLMQFFDQLRDKKVLPEPKNYGTWRKQIEDIITSAKDGLYLEDWELANGATYRVTGRPHPDGAVAFLFEDITDTVSLTRRFHSQISLRESVLDASDQAKIVFGPDNIVTLCNLTCRMLFDVDPDASFADMSLRDFLSVCDEKLPQEFFWDRIEQAILARKEINDLLQNEDGSTYLCRVRALPGNSAILTLRAVLTEAPETLLQQA